MEIDELIQALIAARDEVGHGRIMVELYVEGPHQPNLPARGLNFRVGQGVYTDIDHRAEVVTLRATHTPYPEWVVRNTPEGASNDA